MKKLHIGARTLLFMLVFAMLVNPLLVTTAHAQTDSVVMSPEEWGKTVWMSDWNQRYEGDEKVKATMTAWVLYSLFQANPNLSRNEAISQIVEYSDQYQKEITEGQSYWEARTRTVIEEGLKGVSAIGPLLGKRGEIAGAVGDLLGWINGMAWDLKDGSNSESAIHKLYAMQETVRGREGQVLQNAFELAEQNPEFAYAFNAYFRPNRNIEDAGLDPAPLIDANPSLVPPTIKNRIVYRPDGSILIAINDVKQAVADNSALLNEVINNQKAVAQEIDQLQKNFNAYVASQEAKEIAQQKAEAAALVNNLKLQAATSGVYIVSTLIGVVDPKLGQKVSVVGNAGIEVAKSMVEYTNTMAKLGDLVKLAEGGAKVLDLASNLGAVILTGNILGAVMNVVALFQESGPTDEQLILEQVGQLRQQVEDVRQQMHQRFDRIDSQLNRIYGDMMNQFSLINLSQWEIRNDIHDIQTNLMDVEMDLHAIEAEMSDWIQEGTNSRLYERINYVVGYHDRFPVPIDANTYYGYQNTFYFWATQEAKSSINAGSDNLTIDQYSDTGRAFDHLSQPLDQRINYMANWLTVHGLPSFTDRRLANPQIWALSTRTYAQMKYDWPDFALVHDPNKLELSQIRQVGTDLSNAIRGVTTMATAEGPRGNRPLFNGLTNYYTSTVSGLQNALQGVENNYIQQLLITSLKHPSNQIDFWGGANQPVSYQPSGLWCDYAGMPAPSTLLSWIPSPYLVRNFLTSETQRGQGTAKVNSCWRAGWADERTQQLPNGSEQMFGKLQLEVYVQYENNFVSIVYYKGNEESIGHCNGNELEPVCWFNDAEEIVQNNWTAGRNYKGLLETSASPLPISDGEQQARTNLLAQVSGQVDQSLRTHQKAMYEAILASLSEATDQRTAARGLEVGRIMLADLIHLGMPRALTTDEYLRSFVDGGGLQNHQRLFGEGMVSNWYSAAYFSLLKDEGQPLSEDALAMVEWLHEEYGAQPLTRNPRNVLKQAIDSRVTLLNQWLEKYFVLVDQGVYKDSEPMVEVTLLQLEVYDTVGRLARTQPQPTPSPEPTDPSTPPVPTATPVPPVTETPAPQQPGTPTPQTPNDPNVPQTPVWIMPDTGGQFVGEAGMEITLNFAPGSYPEAVELRMEPVVDAPPTGGRALLGQVFSIVAFDSQQRPVTQFAKPYTMVIRYADVAEVAEEQVSLHFWDGARWVVVPTVVDSANNTLTATLDHLTIFAGLEQERFLFLPSVQTHTQSALASSSAVAAGGQ